MMGSISCCPGPTPVGPRHPYTAACMYECMQLTWHVDDDEPHREGPVECHPVPLTVRIDQHAITFQHNANRGAISTGCPLATAVPALWLPSQPAPAANASCAVQDGVSLMRFRPVRGGEVGADACHTWCTREKREAGMVSQCTHLP